MPSVPAVPTSPHTVAGTSGAVQVQEHSHDGGPGTVWALQLGVTLTGTRHTCSSPEKGPCSSRENFTLERSSAKEAGAGEIQGSLELKQVLQTDCHTNPILPSPLLGKGTPYCSAHLQPVEVGSQKTSQAPVVQVTPCLTNRDLPLSKDGEPMGAL